MKLRKYSFAVLAAGIFAVLSGFVVPLVALCNFSDNGPSVGIIGGADGPTTLFLLREVLDGMPICLLLLGVVLILSALFCLIFSKTVHANCSLRTTLISLGLSATGGAGLNCVLIWYAIAAFQEASKHPIAYPGSIIGGLLALTGFAVLLFWYFGERNQRPSWKGLTLDVVTAVLYLPFFFYALSCLYGWLSGIGRG